MEYEEQKMFEALNNVFKHKKEKEFIEDIIGFYGKKEMISRLIKYYRVYKAKFRGEPFSFGDFAFSLVREFSARYFKKISEIFPEWYEDYYIPHHTEPRKKWKEKAKENSVSEEMLQNNISSFFKLMEIREEYVKKMEKIILEKIFSKILDKVLKEIEEV